MILIDHKSLPFVFREKPAKSIPYQFQYLDYLDFVGQFMRHFAQRTTPAFLLIFFLGLNGFSKLSQLSQQIIKAEAYLPISINRGSINTCNVSQQRLVVTTFLPFHLKLIHPPRSFRNFSYNLICIDELSTWHVQIYLQLDG